MHDTLYMTLTATSLVFKSKIMVLLQGFAIDWPKLKTIGKGNVD
ncbi:hypothetical protein [Vibrio lamellibrachiae]